MRLASSKLVINPPQFPMADILPYGTVIAFLCRKLPNMSQTHISLQVCGHCSQTFSNLAKGTIILCNVRQERCCWYFLLPQNCFLLYEKKNLYLGKPYQALNALMHCFGLCILCKMLLSVCMYIIVRVKYSFFVKRAVLVPSAKDNGCMDGLGHPTLVGGSKATHLLICRSTILYFDTDPNLIKTKIMRDP